MLQTTPLAASTQAFLHSRHISNVINIVNVNNVSSSSFLTISCVAFADVGSACGATVRRIHFRVELFISALNYHNILQVPVPEAIRRNSSFASLRVLSSAIILPLSDNSLVFVGIACGNLSNVNISVAVVSLPSDNSLLMLKLHSMSASIQFPFAIPANYSSGQVSFGTSTSLTGDFAFDFIDASLHCADSSMIADAVASVATGVQPELRPMSMQGAIFNFAPSAPAVTTDMCWARARLLDIVSGQTVDIDGSWSVLDLTNSFDVNCVFLQLSEAQPTVMMRDASVAVVVVIGSTMILTASCNAPSLTVTWVFSKHFDVEFTNSSSGQSARFEPLPHHGGGKFRVLSIDHILHTVL
jgi:hypothetical protein